MTPELAARYAETFAACWRETQPERFLDCFCASMTPQIRLEQPLVPTSTGHEAFRREFGLPPAAWRKGQTASAQIQ